MVAETKRRSCWSIGQTLKVLGISRSTYHRWRKAGPRSGSIKPRSSPNHLYAVLPSERRAIIDYALQHPEVRHRELAWKMLDQGVCAVSMASVYRVLRESNLVYRWKPRAKAKGTGREDRPGVPDKQWLVEQLRVAMANLPGYEFAFTQPIEMRTAEMLTGSRGDLAVKIFGPDLQVLSDVSARIQSTLRSVPGAAEVSTVANDSVDYMQIRVDRLTSGRTGLSVTRLQDELRSVIEGRRSDWWQSPDGAPI